MIIGHAKLCHLIICDHHRAEPVWGRSIAQLGTRDIRAFWGTAAQRGQPAVAASENFRGLKKRGEKKKYVTKCSFSCCCLHIVKGTIPFSKHFTGHLQEFTTYTQRLLSIS